MLYRKFSADNIFTGHQMLEAGNVLITDSQGAIIEIIPVVEVGDDVQHFRGILSPGFINAHCHLELSHMKGYIPENIGLVDFVFKVVFERHFEEEEVFAAIENAEKEMLQNGIVAVGDICNNVMTILQKSKRNLRYYNFIEASGFPPAVAENRFQRSLDFYKQYRELFTESSIVPHAPYSVSPELFRRINDFPGNKVLTIHNQETAAENEMFQKGTGDFLRLFQTMNIDISFFKPTGKTSLQTYLPNLSNQQSLILVHNVCTTENDIEFQKQLSSLNYPFSISYCLCPNANQYIAGQLPDVNLLMDQQCNIVLGTDSLASNHQLSILEEMKTLQQHFPSLSTATLLQWATINGAKALQMDDVLGSFEKGKKPGLILIDNLGHFSLTSSSTSKRIL
ncbi:MAG: amidohydrolase family protein [Chitinophagaceae bacterium]|nr:amidohydrolase family protein [Chitinophagaceae bacterium]